MKTQKEKLIEALLKDERLIESLEPKMTPYIKSKPTPKQAAAMLLNHILFLFFGGAAGGGKSIWLLMEALQYVDVPGYSAILMRDTYSNLVKPGGLQAVSHEWLANTDAKWSGEKKMWYFPCENGGHSHLSFGFLDGPKDHYNYLGVEYQFIGIDEIVCIRKHQAMYMFSRLRRKQTMSGVPLRVRAASNPPGQENMATGSWVKDMFIDKVSKDNNTVFIPAGLEDNQHIAAEDYKRSLSMLDPITRRQLLYGDWFVSANGGLFQSGWFNVIDAVPSAGRWVRFWDLAATETKLGFKARRAKDDPDYTVGALLCYCERKIYIVDIIRVRRSSFDVEQLVKRTAEEDGRRVKIRMEQEGGASGKAMIESYRNLLVGYDFKGRRSTGSKTEYAGPLSSQAEAGNVFVLRAKWNEAFFEEADVFPHGVHDDQIDAASKALSEFVTGKRVGTW